MHIARPKLFLGLSLLLLATIFVPHGVLAQGTPTRSCPAGQGVNSQYFNTGQACQPFTGTIGNDIVRTGQTAALGTQTICDTTSACPAGLVTVLVYITPVTTGLTLSSVAPTITFTDPVSTKTSMVLTSTAGVSSLSLLTTAPGSYIFFLYHVANTAITVNTNFVPGTGSPSYNFYSRLLW